MNRPRPTVARRNAAHRRAGIAPLELVMSLPFLIGAFAMTGSVCVLSMARSTSAVDARQAVWQCRPHGQEGTRQVVAKSTTPTKPLAAVQSLDSLAGMIYGERENEVKLYVGFGTRTARGRAAVVANTWDHKALAADGNGDFGGNGPHLKVLGRMAISGAAGALAGLTGVTDMSSAEVSDPEADKAIQDAEKQKEEAEQAQQDAIDQLKEQKEAARERRDAALAEKEQLRLQREGVLDSIKAIDDQLALQNPKDPALVAQRGQLVDQAKDLKSQMDEKQKVADAEQAEMDRLQKEIDKYEDAAADGEKEQQNLP